MYSQLPLAPQQVPAPPPRPAVNLDDLFGGPAPAPSANAAYPAPYSALPPADAALGLPPPYEGCAASPYGLPTNGHAYAAVPGPVAQGGAPVPMTGSYPLPPHATMPAPHAYYSAAVPQTISPAQPVTTTALAPPPPATPVTRSQEDEDKAQLEKIIRLRRELELEQEREQRKREEMQTWGCTQCTFRNKLSVTSCEMCGLVRPGYAASKPATAAPASPPLTERHTAPTPTPVPAMGDAHAASWSQWQCSSCSTINDNKLNRCKACNAFRHTGIPLGATPTTMAAPPAAPPVATPFTCNWSCSVCGTINPPSRSNCSNCNGYQRNGTPVTDAVASHPPAVSPQSAPSGPAASHSAVVVRSNGVLLPAPSSTWTCSVCTVENPVSVELCKVCQSGVRPRHLSPQTKPAPPHGSHSHRSSHSKESGRHTWPCPTCTFINPQALSKCDMCGCARPERFAPPPSAHDAERKKREEESDEEEVQWQEDTVVQSCNRCHQNFGLLRRRHHCRACGYVFCADCSAFQIPLKKGGEPQRVCASCFEARQKDK